MENLNRQNFWDRIYAKYPGEVQRFCDWIDEYKKRVGWTDMFREKKPVGSLKSYAKRGKIKYWSIEETEWEGTPNAAGWDNPKDVRIIGQAVTVDEAQAFIDRNKKPNCSYWYSPVFDNGIKYDDLPLAMQFGIFLQFIAESNSGSIEFFAEHPKDMEKISELIEEYFFYEHDDAMREHQEEKNIEEEILPPDGTGHPYEGTL